jgi:dimethylhistidine N-methyltransferase
VNTAHASSAATIDAAERDEVLDGLRAEWKTLPPKLFYDQRGAELFERICELPEYYLTRSELEILRAHAGDIADLAGARCAVIEYGSGAGVKARLLLDALESPVAYVPVDISRSQLLEVASDMSADYPRLAVTPVCADYTSRFQLPDILPREIKRLAFFPGSTIGNFHPSEAVEFLKRIRDLVGPLGAMVLGVDRRKSRNVLDAAYNDSAGITAEFNLNILRRLNRDLRAEFDLDAFEHAAFFNEDAGRIEMHLRSVRDQTVCVAGEAIHFDNGETIWTESSYKYSREALDELLDRSGFKAERLWTDDQERFWVAYLTS